MAHISSQLMSYRWDDNRLRTYLEEKGVIKTKQQATRDELLAKMRETYAATANPVWQAWSDSYLVSSSILECITLKLITIGCSAQLVGRSRLDSLRRPEDPR